jgi:hypothetical protein
LVNVFVALHEAPRIDLKMNKIGEQLQRARNRFSQLQF